MNEIEEKLSDKFSFLGEDLRLYLEYIIFMSAIVEPTKKHFAIKDDPKDNKIIDCAVEGNAEYIVSGDQHLLKIKNYKGIKMVTPKEFFEFFRGEKQ